MGMNYDLNKRDEGNSARWREPGWRGVREEVAQNMINLKSNRSINENDILSLILIKLAEGILNCRYPVTMRSSSGCVVIRRGIITHRSVHTVRGGILDPSCARCRMQGLLVSQKTQVAG